MVLNHWDYRIACHCLLNRFSRNPPTKICFMRGMLAHSISALHRDFSAKHKVCCTQFYSAIMNRSDNDLLLQKVFSRNHSHSYKGLRKYTIASPKKLQGSELEVQHCLRTKTIHLCKQTIFCGKHLDIL